MTRKLRRLWRHLAGLLPEPAARADHFSTAMERFAARGGAW